MKMLLVCVLATLAICKGQIDQTLQEKAKGYYVAEAVVDLIRAKCVFPDDNLFFRRLAFVESKDGEAAGTFSPGNDGGIWQVNDTMLILTKSVSNVILSSVQTEYGINWSNVILNDLLKPLYSGLAARLYLQYIQEKVHLKIPTFLAAQANYWQKRYNPSGDANNFITKSNELKNVCKGTVDLAFMLDGSGSVGSTNFTLMKNFAKKIVSQLNVGPDPDLNSRVALTVFESAVYPNFLFSSYSTYSEYESAINAVAYSGGGTKTHLALNYLTSKTFKTSLGARSSGIPKIAVVVTDGRSRFKGLTLSSAANLLSSGIKVFAVGVGGNVDFVELNAIASDPDCIHLFHLNNFQEFDAFVAQIEKKVCQVETEIDDTLTTSVGANSTKFYYYNLTLHCSTLKISSINGDADVYFAASYQPNPAQYDDFLRVTPAVPGFIYSPQDSDRVFITVAALTDIKFTFTFLKQPCSAINCPLGFQMKKFGARSFKCVLATRNTQLSTPTTTTTTTTTTKFGPSTTIFERYC